MKADSCGTATEQQRFRAGFLTAKQRPTPPSCGNCRHLAKRYEDRFPQDKLYLSCGLHSFSVTAGAICNDHGANKP